MAHGITLKLREIRPTFRIIQGWIKGATNPPACNPNRRLRKQKMAAFGFTSGKSYRRYRLALRRDYEYRTDGLSD